MIKKIRAAFKDNVKTLDWMDEITKKAVEEKVHKVIRGLLSLFSVCAMRRLYLGQWNLIHLRTQ